MAAAAVRAGGPGEVQDRERRPVRGPAAQRRTGAAIIGDPRNDENLIIAGPARRVPAASTTGWSIWCGERRRRCRTTTCSPRRARLATLALPVADPARVPAADRRAGLVNDVLAQRPAVLPAAHRPGVHAGRVPDRRLPVRPQHGAAVVPRQLRPGDNGAAVLRLDLRPGAEGSADSDDLRGGSRAPRRFVGWQTFFDFGDGRRRDPNKLIDTKISTPLFQLPIVAIASGDPPTSLPQRNLLRHLTWSLPSGQALAAAMGTRRCPAGEMRRDRSRDICPAVPRVDAAVVLHPQGGARCWRRAHASARSAAASSPRCSSACCRPIPSSYVAATALAADAAGAGRQPGSLFRIVGSADRRGRRSAQSRTIACRHVALTDVAPNGS